MHNHKMQQMHLVSEKTIIYENNNNENVVLRFGENMHSYTQSYGKFISARLVNARTNINIVTLWVHRLHVSRLENIAIKRECDIHIFALFKRNHNEESERENRFTTKNILLTYERS